MGVGVSSLRLRKAVVLRAYNLRDGDQTLEEQFRKYAFRGEDGKLCISLLDIKNCLCFSELSWADDMIRRLLGENMRPDIIFSEFVEFLETGQAPLFMRASCSESTLLNADTTITDENEGLNRCSSASTDFGMNNGKKKTTRRNGQKNPIPGRSRSKDLPPQPPNPSSQHNEVGGASDDPASSYDPNCDVMVASKGLNLIVHPKDTLSRGSPSSSVWRKRELVRQERTVQYTTIDANGTLQELVEKETSETEVLHMESRETGEFAHRETTVYEQRETFNDEVVAEQHGTEEYVHLRSLDDEFEYMESTMPRKPGAQSQEGGPDLDTGDGMPAVSPRVEYAAGEAQSAAAAEEDLDEETLAYLQYQELMRQQRENLDTVDEGGNVEYHNNEGEVGEAEDDTELPESWWRNAAETAYAQAAPISIPVEIPQTEIVDHSYAVEQSSFVDID